MNGRGGCCLVRYAGDTEVASKVELIMLRYRPIAPKPATSPGGSPTSGSQGTEAGGESTGRGRTGGSGSRRRGRREGAGRRGRKRRAPYSGEVAAKKSAAPPAGDLVTLPLMPETPAVALAASSSSYPPPDLSLGYPPSWGPYVVEGPGAVEAPAGSWVTLESVTETCEVAGDGRCTWAEVRAALEGDDCPAFLSDGIDRVAWTNAAYRRMVAGAGEAGGVVALATGGQVPRGAACGGFSCWVRVRCARLCGGKAWSLVVPCDVWRLAEEGWLVWRLDLQAALSLGR